MRAGECLDLFLNRHSQEDSPTAQPDTSTSRPDSNPPSATAVDNSFKVFSPERLDWLPLPDVHGTLNSSTTYGRAGDSGSSAYMNSGSSNGGDTGLSPDTGHSSSNRPTPNSTSPSESRPGQKISASSSYQKSPEMLHRTQPQNKEGTHSHVSIPTSGLTPDNTFSMPATPGRDFVPPGWETNGQTTGFTPIGEGVFRQLYGLGPLDAMPMDLGWEGSPET